jgi:hypothetical protein
MGDLIDLPNPRSRWFADSPGRRAFLPFVLTLVVAGCSSGTPTPTPSAGSSATSQPTTSPPASATPLPIIGATCTPNANDACLGNLAAGTQSSVLFAPRITFDNPGGWFNHADSAGEYVLIAPGAKPKASEFGAVDWIAFEANVTLTPEGCDPQTPFDASKSATDIAAWMAGRSNLTTTSPRPVSVGGLTGVVLDVRLADNALVECLPLPGVFLVHGLPPSDGYDQLILAGTAMRFYFFDHGDDVLMIEIDDVSGGDRLDEFSAVLDTVSFGL